MGKAATSPAKRAVGTNRDCGFQIDLSNKGTDCQANSFGAGWFHFEKIGLINNDGVGV